MIWRDTSASAMGEIDPERELELRLIAHAHAGAAWALSSLVARYQPPVVRYLIRLTGDQERAHALAEQVFVRMARRLRGPHRGEQLRLWLLRTATEAGLDVLRRPASNTPAQIAAPVRSPALLPGKVRQSAMSRLLRTLGGHKRNTPRLAPPTQEFVWSDLERGSGMHGHDGVAAELLSPREQVRHRLIRAVLAELTYSDAQCLALHLVAGLNQTEVALALGVAAPIARRRIVQGLQIFGRRYEATLASLGLPKDFADADVAHVRFTESGAVIARGAVPDETGVAEGAGGESDALRREREVTGTLVVPNRALPALEEFFANEPPAPLPSASSATPPGADIAASEAEPSAPSALDPLAATAVFLPAEPVELPDPWSAVMTSSPPDTATPPATDEPALQEEPAALAPELSEGTQTVEYGHSADVAVDGAENVEPTVELASPVAAASDLQSPPADIGADAQDDWYAPQASSPERVLERGANTPAEVARVVPVLSAATVSRAGYGTHPLATDVEDAAATAEDATPVSAGRAAAPPDTHTPEPDAIGIPQSSAGDDLLIEWDSNPQIPIHVRSDINALLDQQDVSVSGVPPDDGDWLLVLEDEQNDASDASLESRRRRVLSADGEAEDPDESVW